MLSLSASSTLELWIYKKKKKKLFLCESLNQTTYVYVIPPHRIFFWTNQFYRFEAFLKTNLKTKLEWFSAADYDHTLKNQSVLILLSLSFVLVIPLLLPWFCFESFTILFVSADKPFLQEHFEAYLINCYFKPLPLFFSPRSANLWTIGVKTLTLIDLLSAPFLSESSFIFCVWS